VLETVYKKIFMAYFKIIFQRLLGWTEESHTNFTLDRQFPSRDFNSGLPEYEG
jgi:hypothetical protein